MNNPMEIEMRGYEVARRVGSTWVPVIKYSNSAYALAKANDDARYLQRNHPEEQYKVRVIVSANPDRAPEPPLVLEEDGEESNASQEE